MHKWLWILAAFYWTFCLGCAPAAFPKEIGEVAKSAALSMTDQAVWKQVTANVDGQVVNPGIRVGAGVMYIAEAQLTGVSGQVGLRGTGVGNDKGNSEAANAAIRAMLSQTDFVQQIVNAVLAKIGAADATFRAPASTDQPASAPGIVPMTP